MSIPITKPYFDEKELEKVKECLESGWVTQGPMTVELENEFSRRHNSKYSIAVSSCTAALHIAMLALGIGEGDEVIVPAFTWITSASCIDYVGASVRFVDVDKSNMNIDYKKLEEAITHRTKAIVVVHLFGCAANMKEIMRIAEIHDLKVVEDCACAIGTTYEGKPVGTFGDIGCFSFHPRKAITTGEGGMCTTNSQELTDKMRQFRNHGARANQQDEEFGKPYYMGIYDELGFNLRLSDIQAAVGLAQFEKLDMLLADRRKSAEYYLSQLSDLNELILPNVPKKLGHTYQSFVILLPDGQREKRNAIMNKMQENGIQSRPGTIAIHRTQFNKEQYNIKEEDYSIAAYCEDCSITLPIYPFMKREEQDIIINLIKNMLS